MDWTPTISDRQGPIYQRIVNALADDIAAGRVHSGQPLPTHRALATALGVDVTTVTRAYTEAGRQGLTEARVGRGTYVKGAAPQSTRPLASPGIDLSMNLPPQPAHARFDSRLAHSLGEIRAGPGFAAYFAYQQPAGTLNERQIAAAWMDAVLPGVTADRVLLAPGTQAALYALLAAHTQPGDTVLTECLTYPGIKAVATAVGVTLAGVAMDGDGMIPAALDRAARAHAAKLVYLMPTIHNPTTITMPEERRRRIADVIRKRGLVLIEDDPYSFLAPGSLPLTALIPDRSYLAASLAKCIAPGFRASILVTPDTQASEKVAKRLRAMLQMSVPLMAAVLTRWMRDGTASAIVDAVRAEAVARQSLARKILGPDSFAAHPQGLHAWVPLPDGLPAGRFAAELHGRGLAVVTADAFAVDAEPPGAIRLALGAAQNRAQLVKALEILSGALTSGGLKRP
ncbi:PLP-dependent aminotransferase family protein [Hyphomicrobium sp.]|uniref:aminotransferase-like domain-containing protein n=1 Tax=Hyphomicrobium sp. TaxID=82 RepID=UPI003F6EB34D